MTSDPERLRACLGGPEWTWLRRRLHDCLAREKPLPAVCSRSAPSAAEWEAAAALMGQPAGAVGKVLRIRPAELEARLQRGGLCASLREAIETLDGPIPSLPAEARREQETWVALAATFTHNVEGWCTLVEERRPDLGELADAMAVGGVVDVDLLRALCGRDAAAAEPLGHALARVFETLAALGSAQVHRAHLAARALGDSHALDTHTMLYRALAGLAGRSADRPHEMWRLYGVMVDQVSSSVLTLNLHFKGTALAGAVDGFAAAGEPCRLLLRHIAKLQACVEPMDTLYVCENPSILEAAAIELGAACAPMICTEGQPSLACQGLLVACAESVDRLCYHGDYDWGGIRIANFVWQVIPSMTPWRYDADHYERLTDGLPLAGTPVDATWDARLAPAMSRRTRAFHEEQSLPDLLADLAGAAGRLKTACPGLDRRRPRE